MLSLNTLTLAFASESSEIIVSTDKDVYTVGETVEIKIFMDPHITCFCLEHEWGVIVTKLNGNIIVKRWYWKAPAGEAGFRGKTIYWTPSEAGKYEIIAELITHNASASKVIEVVVKREEAVEYVETVEYIYRTDEFDLKIIVPKYLTLSLPQQRIPNPIELFILKKVETLSGFLTISPEAGIKVMVSIIPPTVSLYVFLDVDVDVLGTPLTDLFTLMWPISIPPLNLEEGDIGMYASLIPVDVAKTQLEALPVGEWHRIGTYHLYVDIKPEYLMTLGQPPTDKTDAVKGFVSEETKNYKELYENLLQKYNSLREKYNTLKDENRMLKDKVSDLEGIIGQLRGEVSSLKSQVASLEQALSQAEETLKETKDKLVVAENELTQWRMLTLIVGLAAFVAGLVTTRLITKIR